MSSVVCPCVVTFLLLLLLHCQYDGEAVCTAFGACNDSELSMEIQPVTDEEVSSYS